MPEKIGPFERGEVLQYDEAGLNLSAGYDALVGSGSPLPVVVTLYVYPATPGHSLDAHFDSLLTQIGEAHGGARPQVRKDILLSPRHYVGRYAVFGYEEPWGGQAEDVHLRSYLVLYRWKDWWVKWRVTTPGPMDGERMRAIVELTETLLPPDDQPRPEGPSESELGPEKLARHDKEETWDSPSVPTAS
jgi:hypothetical protein